MAVEFSHLVLLLAFLTTSGCASPQGEVLQASVEMPSTTQEAQPRLPSPKKHPSGLPSDELVRRLPAVVPAANQSRDESVARALYDQNDSSWANEATSRPYGESARHVAAWSDDLEVPTSISVSGDLVPTSLSDAHTSDEEMTRLPPVERPSRDFTYRDLFASQAEGVVSDHCEFYSADSMTRLAAGVGAGALMANTAFDEHFLRDTYAENIVLAPSDELYEVFHEPKFLGEGYYTIAAFAATALAEPLIDDLPFGSETAEWGQRSLRTILVGAPPMLALQVLTGGSRPGETTAGSKWKPFQDNNGVSGHSFMGAVPFMSAAKMTANVWLKSGLYVVSALPALSRVNDDDHYFSQAFLGWWIAYVAASAVDNSHSQDSNHHLFVYPQQDGVGLEYEYVH